MCFSYWWGPLLIEWLYTILKILGIITTEAVFAASRQKLVSQLAYFINFFTISSFLDSPFCFQHQQVGPQNFLRFKVAFKCVFVNLS